MSLSWFDIVLCIGGLLLALLNLAAIRSGRVQVLPSNLVLDRAESPLTFWIAVALQMLAAISLLAIAFS